MKINFSIGFLRNFLILVLSFGLYGLGFAAAPPSQVTGVEAKLIGDNSVNLTWNEAISEEGIITGYRVYYGKNSVQSEDDFYEEQIDVGARTSYPIENLDYGTTYYFAVTAFDDELQESLNYSEEVSVEIPAKQEEETTENTAETHPAANENTNTEETATENTINPSNENEELTPNEEPTANEEEIDTVPPLDVTDLNVDKSNLKNRKTVTLRWKKSRNTDGDVADQIFYVKRGNGDWDQGYSIGKDLEEMVFDVRENTDYAVKIVTVDQAGNRSLGTTLTFSTTTLATSGPGMLFTLSVVAIIMFFYLSFRRRT